MHSVATCCTVLQHVAFRGNALLRNVTVIERETPQYVDEKTDQVALKFRLKADWPLEAPSKPVNQGGGG